MTQPPVDPATAQKLMQMITGHWVAQAIYSVVKLGVPDQFAEGARGVDDVAATVKSNPDALYRVLRALSSVGLFREREGRRFELAPGGELLRADHPQSMREMSLFQGAPPHWTGWGSLVHAVQTGKSAFEHVHGMGFFDYCLKDKEFGAAFNGAMTGMSANAARAVLDAYDFSGIRRLVDVGGGHGYLLSRILEKYPSMQGVIADLPDVVEGARPALAAAGLSDRCELVGGSFFDSVPPGDAYIAKHIIHDWDDEHARKILANMRSAMTGTGKVLLVELVIEPESSSDFAPLLDLEMLNSTHGGRERTESEFAALFESAGLRLTRVIATKSANRILEAIPR